MKTMLSGLVVSSAVFAQAAFSAVVSWTAGVHAVIHPSVAAADGGSFYAYTVTGGMTLKLDGNDHALSIHCTGLDRAGESGLRGQGACTWTDADGGVLSVELETSEAGNAYTITGGTGRWAGAKGELNSSFAFLPGPSETFILGTESGSGQLVLSQ